MENNDTPKRFLKWDGTLSPTSILAIAVTLFGGVLWFSDLSRDIAQLKQADNNQREQRIEDRAALSQAFSELRGDIAGLRAIIINGRLAIAPVPERQAAR